MKAIKNIRLVTTNGVLEDKTIIFNDKILYIEDVDQSSLAGMEVIDGGGNYLSPGFINIHVHGCSGYDVMDEEGLKEISRNLIKTGVTSYLPTTMTMEFQRIEAALKRIRQEMGNREYAEVLGCHMEGPFINKNYKGAQDDKYILTPEFSKIEPYLDIIKIITMAPEIEGSEEFIKKCVENKVVVSIGHSNASFEQAKRAIELGVQHITHTFNAMTSLHHREPGVVGAAFLHDVTCEIIPDNIHVHPAAQNILLRLKGKDKIIIITDSMRACLLRDGVYELGGQIVQVKGKEARLKDGTLAGSVLEMNLGLRNFLINTNINIWEVINMATLNPAKLLGIESKKGSIEKGKDADMVLFDGQFNVLLVIKNGNVAYWG